MEPNASAVVDDAGPPSWPPALTAPSFSYSLVFGVTFALLSQLSSIGKGMQKVGVTLPTLTSNPQVVWQYLSNSEMRHDTLMAPTWMMVWPFMAYLEPTHARAAFSMHHSPPTPRAAAMCV